MRAGGLLVGEAGADDEYLAYFFIPLPESLGIPTGSVFRFDTPEDASVALARMELGDDLELVTETFCSVVAHSMEWTRPSHGVDDHLVKKVESVLPWLTSKSDPVPATSEMPLPALTLLEVAVFVRSPDEAGISDAFDEAVGAVQALQRAYYLATQLPTTLVRREALPYMVLSAVARVTDDELVEHAGLGPFLCHMHLDYAHEQLDYDTQFKPALDMTMREGPMRAYTDAMRDARVAHLLRGEYKSAAVFYASAAESLLQNVLLHLMWEGGLSPQQASDEFDTVRAGLRSRVKILYKERLKGGWDLTRGALSAWDTKTAELRHRVVHAGYEPTAAECQDSLGGLLELEAFITERLSSTAVLPKFPRTALALMGEPGLRRRGKWNGVVRRLAQDPDQPPWVERFNLWREVFEVIRRGVDGKPVPAPDALAPELLIVCKGDGFKWIRRDRAVRRAVEVKPTDEAAVAAVIKTAKKMAAVDGIYNSMVVAPSTPTTVVGEWEWDFELIPEVEHGPTY